jgi:hypothetical protein
VHVTVWTGQAEVATSTYAIPVHPGQTVLVSEHGYQMVAMPAQSEFDQWSLARHAEEDRALRAASPYVSPAMTGYEDLGRYGTWRHVDAYGIVWVPAAGPGWTPYRDGRWVWISPWGWTWIDNAPWGFAPFHYGRWILIGGVWAWVPGPVVVRPIFAPALVVFIVIGDVIGWFPLAPHEVFVPWYPVSPIYRRNINITVVNVNITNINITNVNYIYRRSPRAITLVRRDAFVQARPVGGSLIAASQPEIARSTVAVGAPMPPRLESVLGRPQHSAGSHRPPAEVERRPVVVRRDPPPPPPPGVSAPGAQLRTVPVRRAVERREDAAPRPAPTAAPRQPVAPAPQAPPVHPVAVPTPHRRGREAPPQPQPNQPAPQPNQPAPQPNAPAPQPAPVPAPRPGVGAPQPGPQPAAPSPEPQPVPTPHPRRPGNALQPPQPNAPAPQQTPQPRPEPPVVQPPRQAPRPAPPEPPAPLPRQQPGVQPPGVVAPTPPAAPPQVRPVPPQVRPAPRPRNPGGQPNCDPRSPNYDPRACTQRPHGR